MATVVTQPTKNRKCSDFRFFVLVTVISLALLFSPVLFFSKRDEKIKELGKERRQKEKRKKYLTNSTDHTIFMFRGSRFDVAAGVDKVSQERLTVCYISGFKARLTSAKTKELVSDKCLAEQHKHCPKCSCFSAALFFYQHPRE